MKTQEKEITNKIFIMSDGYNTRRENYLMAVHKDFDRSEKEVETFLVLCNQFSGILKNYPMTEFVLNFKGKIISLYDYVTENNTDITERIIERNLPYISSDDEKNYKGKEIKVLNSALKMSVLDGCILFCFVIEAEKDIVIKSDWLSLLQIKTIFSVPEKIIL